MGWQCQRLTALSRLRAKRRSTMLAKKFESLLNGGGTVAGVKGLETEVAALAIEMDGFRSEVGQIPARRALAITSDDNFAATVEKLEARERELYRCLERAEFQKNALERRLEEIRAQELVPHLERYRTEVDEHVMALDRALVVAVAENAQLARLSNEAARELGPLAGKLYVGPFAGLVTQECLTTWRDHLK